MNPQEAKKLEAKVLKSLKNALKKNDILIAAISGGPDSIFLLHFLKQLPNKIIVAHLNHCLRKEAEKDQKFVQEQSKNLIFETKKIDIKKLSEQTKTGLEECGRKQRYKFFQYLAKKYQAKYILTAHHADDNVETIIFNLTRGATLAGLAGMQKSEKINKNTYILRPLLEISKKQILDYLKHKKISYHEDTTNKDTHHSRNFIRHEIIPKLKKLNPSVEETVSKNSIIINDADKFIKEKASLWLEKNLQNSKNLNAKSFLKQKKIFQKYILLEIHQILIGNTTNIKNIHLEEILSIIEKNIGNKKKKFGKLTIYIRTGIITVEKI